MADMVEVTILGQHFKLRTDTGNDYVHELAEYVESLVEELRRNSRSASTDRVALMAALQIADRYFQLRQRTEGNKELANGRIQRLIEATDRVLAE
ncbi:cell division protein ZapA [Magnetococcus marinus MC-1]|uniref:Cell division protein ZapA n=1 Tax=Magnetococcus marinus (strain ATCC BAA-1437 / JCM 17883 / MC-1) TaxID=156889 RepID=A0L5J1_MAGMM|nr:cell division protein ZapA [Magnetococcus marinus]ABK43234.1 cell division protein ZapA [Magnetococcus marinus MC-1]